MIHLLPELLVQHGAMDSEAYARWRGVSRDHRDAIDSEHLSRKIPQDFWEVVPGKKEAFEASGLRPWALVAFLDAFEKTSQGLCGPTDLKKAVAGLLPASPPETFDSFVGAVRVLLSLVTYSHRYPNRQRADFPRWAACALMEFLDRSFSSPRFCAVFRENSPSRFLNVLRRKCTELAEQAMRTKDSDRDHTALFLGYTAIVSRHVTRLSST
jgi:hypothetical protein